jgi:hypothetical protein
MATDGCVTTTLLCWTLWALSIVIFYSTRSPVLPPPPPPAPSPLPCPVLPEGIPGPQGPDEIAPPIIPVTPAAPVAPGQPEPATPTEGKVLVVYVYFEKNALYKDNLQFFSDVGVQERDDIDFVFVIQGNCSVEVNHPCAATSLPILK